MDHGASQYNIAAIRQLLLAAFTVEDLRRFCEERREFEPILQDTSPNSGLADTVDKVITRCKKRMLFPELLAEIKEYRPRLWLKPFRSGRLSSLPMQ